MRNLKYVGDFQREFYWKENSNPRVKLKILKAPIDGNIKCIM